MTDIRAGYIKLSRKAFDPDVGDAFWHERRKFSRWEAWVYLIQLASFAKRRHQTKYGPVDLDRGEFVVSLRKLATDLMWSFKSVRTYMASLEKGARVKAQRETQAGMVYLIVNYDTYQSSQDSKGTEKGTEKGTGGAQGGHKREEGKASKEERLTADAVQKGLEVFPKAVCDMGYEAFVARVGSVNYGLFRKLLLPVYQSQTSHHPSGEELREAVEAFVEAREAERPQYRAKYTVHQFASALHEYVRLGKMPLVNEWGESTERGRACGLAI